MDHNEGKRPKSLDDAEKMNRIASADLAPTAGALVQPWRRLGEQLTPLIGESGFCALFGRAQRIAGVRAELLAQCVAAKPLASLFASLTGILNEIGPANAAAANTALLDTFTSLLAELIGEALTKQLLHVASAGADGQKQAQEQK